MRESILVVQVNEDSTKFFLAPADTMNEEDLGTLRNAVDSENHEDMQQLLDDKFDEVRVPLRGQNIGAVFTQVTITE